MQSLPFSRWKEQAGRPNDDDDEGLMMMVMVRMIIMVMIMGGLGAIDASTIERA